MKKHETQEPTREYKVYIRHLDVWVDVTEEQYYAYYRPIWRTRYHAQKNGECRCTKAQIWRCDGDCLVCEFRAVGKEVSMNTVVGGGEGNLTLGDTLADDAPTAPSILEDCELLEALYAELDRLDRSGRRICELLMQGQSEREAAATMDMPRSTFKRHWAKIQGELRDKLKDYYL